MIALLLKAGRLRILTGAAFLILITAVLDHLVGRNVSLAALYILPTMFAAVVLKPLETAALALICSWLRAAFDSPASPAEANLRFVFAAAAYFLSGLFITQLVRKHELVTQHLENIQREQSFRKQAEEQLTFLASSSPAAILTLDANGTVLAANQAANNLIMAGSASALEGRRIGEYLPMLADVLQTEVGREGLRASAQCQGRRENGEIFAAHTWFSSYKSPDGDRLAAIIVDSSDELREREEQGLREMLTGNRIVAAAFLHEVRNFCVAMRLLCVSLRDRAGSAVESDLHGMAALIAGMEAVASRQLDAHSVADVLQPVSLREVLDNLRIVIEPQWEETGGVIEWGIAPPSCHVIADPHGLLQVLMNLSQNSLRAVEHSARKHLAIGVDIEDRIVWIRVSDSGAGVEFPDRLFQPFQAGAKGAGLGLYVSKSLIRSYGGDLRFDASRSPGATFVVELQVS